MYGNSYTAANGLDGLLENLLREVGDANVSPRRGIQGHRSKERQETWNTSLSGQPWDIVVLWISPRFRLPPNAVRVDRFKDAAIALTERIEDEGAEMMLLMTWGRRSGTA